MNAQDVVSEIGQGVRGALTVSNQFLGIEGSTFANADIHPEYVTTVKIAEQLIGADRVVSLETQMKTLREQALRLARLNTLNDRPAFLTIKSKLGGYTFGKKDSQRIDIYVQGDTGRPLLIAEAKLGIRNLDGINKHIDRVVMLLDMFRDAGLMSDGSFVYGAVIFHLMQEGVGDDEIQASIATILPGIQSHIDNLVQKHSWLMHKTGLLSLAHGRVIEAEGAYLEEHDDGTSENIFARKRFAFAPGLVLLGNDQNIGRVIL